MSRFRFALRPKWILSHLFVLALIAGMISAGFWQISRLHEKRDRNARIVARTAEPVVPVEDLLAGPNARTTDLEYRSVTATGTYDPDQILIRSRSDDGAPGSWVVATLRLDDGMVVVVNRGFIHNSGDIVTVPATFAPPKGEVVVGGLLRATQTRGRIGARDPATGTLDNMARVDVARIAKQTKGDVLPMYVSLESQRPLLTTADPAPVPREELDEGPHFGYAVQWFIFTAIAIVGYPLILRRRAREIEKEARLARLDDEADQVVDETFRAESTDTEPAPNATEAAPDESEATST